MSPFLVLFVHLSWSTVHRNLMGTETNAKGFENKKRSVVKVVRRTFCSIKECGKGVPNYSRNQLFQIYLEMADFDHKGLIWPPKSYPKASGGNINIFLDCSLTVALETRSSHLQQRFIF